MAEVAGYIGLADGIYEDMPMSEYLALGKPVVDQATGEIVSTESFISSSIVKEMYWRSEFHALRKLQGADEDDTARKRLGSLVHTAVLEPHLLDVDFYVLPEPDPEKYRTGDGSVSKNVRATSAYKEAVAACAAENLGKTAVEASDLHACALIREGIERCEDARLLCAAEGRIELTVLATDPVTGLRVKGRFDKLLTNRWDLNLKGCRSARFHQFQRDVSNIHFIGAGFYKLLADWAGIPLAKSVILALELDAPHVVKPWELYPDVLDGGERVTRWALDRIALAMKRESWPAYGDRIEGMALTEEAYRRIDERLEERLPE